MRPLATWADLLAATTGDPWVQLHADAWASPDGAWELDASGGRAVAWVSPDPTDLGELQPVVQVMGDPAAAAALCAHVLGERSGGRPVTLPSAAETSLGRHGMRLEVEARWHYRALTAPVPGPAPAGAVWLPAEGATRHEVLGMLQRHAPELAERADVPDVTRWAGVREESTGELLVVCADVSPRTAAEGATIGVLGSIAVHTMHRRQGLGSLVIRWAARAMFGEGRTSVGLAVYSSNAPALATYDRLGFDDREFVTGPAHLLAG